MILVRFFPRVDCAQLMKDNGFFNFAAHTLLEGKVLFGIFWWKINFLQNKLLMGFESLLAVIPHTEDG